MNCKQVEELLPLATGHDLDERREQQIAEHVRRCIDCAAVAVEFRSARQLLTEFKPPQFGESTYAGIRQNVWRQIEAESEARSAWQSIWAWFSAPRMAWALASVVLIGVLVLAIYFIGKRPATRPQLAGDAPSTKQNRENNQPMTLPRSGNPDAGNSEPQQANLGERPRRLGRRIRAERSASVAANSTAAPSDNVATSNQSDSQAGAGTTSPNSDNPLRMEIQTRDPNIRIIWFAQRETKPTKGT